MKKIICLIIIFSFFASTSVSAVDGGMITAGAGAIGLGVFFFLLPGILSSDDDSGDISAPSIVSYSFGSLCCLGGLILIILGAVSDDNDYAKAIVEDPIFKHVNLATNGTDTFIGARFSFK
jgi:hypothetical protein